MRGKLFVRSCVAIVVITIPSAALASDTRTTNASFLVSHTQSIADWLSVILLIALVFAPLFVGAARRQKHLRIVWRTWAGMLGWSILCCLLLPLILQRVTGDSTVWRYFPEPAGIIGVAVAGWIAAAVLTVIVKSVFEFVHSRHDKSAATKLSGP